MILQVIATHRMSTMTLLVKEASHHGSCLSDKRGVARKYSLSDVTSDSDAPNVNKDIVSKKASHHGPVSLMSVGFHVSTH